MTTVADVVEYLENIAPSDLAAEGDPVGLQAGRLASIVNKLYVSVDTSPPVIDKAIEMGADMIVAHHPLIYTPLASLAEDGTIAAKSVVKLIRAHAALYVMHTNWDMAPGGVNDVLANVLGVIGCIPLTNISQDTFYKIVVFVPDEAVEPVRNAMAEAGAGRIGQYTHCSFRVKGTGSFVPLPMADPYVGDIGKLAEVDEYRLEMVCVGSWVQNVLEAMVEKHPYDQVAYDVYELTNEPVIYGYGRVGNLREPMSLEEFAEHVRVTLGVKYIKIAGDTEKPIKRVAVCGGSGSSQFKEAAALGADAYVTGDTKHHDILDANALGLAVIDAGHFETEKPAMVLLADMLKKQYAGNGVNVEYIEG
ncbi:Nif3-like dinuclear metal center hexameric protein [bacterium]|nr:Nif3-like dinuclear metal center hexameric protein [bacterium]